MPAKGRQGQRPNDRWEHFIVKLTADNPGWSQRKIWMQLSVENEKVSLSYRIPGDPPTRRTVDRRVKELRDPKNKEILAARRSVYFPETFQSGGLPWESAPSVMEFMRVYESLERQDGSVRPTVRQAEWFYRLRMVAPDAPAEVLAPQAVSGALLEVMQDTQYTSVRQWGKRILEAFLYYELWPKPTDMHTYQRGQLTRLDINSDLFHEYVNSIMPIEAGKSIQHFTAAQLRELGWTQQQYERYLARIGG